MKLISKLADIQKKLNITNDEKTYINELASLHNILRD
jgi:hypothetical protein